MISKKIGVSKGTVSVWCRDIELTKPQIDSLLKNKAAGIRAGQLKGAEVRKRQRQEIVDQELKDGLMRFKSISHGEFLVCGLALYLAEGAKTKNRVHFVNSDPRIIQFMLDWLQEFFGVAKTSVAPSLLINEIHKPREEVVLAYWSRYLDIPRTQFRATTFVHTKQKKLYENYDRYYGTLRFQVLKGTELSYRIMGLIEGLLQHTKRPA